VPLFTGVRGIGILGNSALYGSPRPLGSLS
jgi:hypothetical protein